MADKVLINKDEKFTPTCTEIKFTDIKGNKTILKASEQRVNHLEGSRNRGTWLNSNHPAARRKHSIKRKVLNFWKSLDTILYPAKLSFKHRGLIKIYPDTEVKHSWKKLLEGETNPGAPTTDRAVIVSTHFKLVFHLSCHPALYLWVCLCFAC